MGFALEVANWLKPQINLAGTGGLQTQLLPALTQLLAEALAIIVDLAELDAHAMHVQVLTLPI